jgi:hypothetical protein
LTIVSGTGAAATGAGAGVSITSTGGGGGGFTTCSMYCLTEISSEAADAYGSGVTRRVDICALSVAFDVFDDEEEEEEEDKCCKQSAIGINVEKLDKVVVLFFA